MYSVSFMNANSAVAAGMIGSLLKTTDSGISWYSIRKGYIKWIESVCFPVDRQTGYICGSGIIMKTTNAGSEWIPQSADGNTVMFRKFYFRLTMKRVMWLAEREEYLRPRTEDRTG
ncbi:MAG: hypothetical protein IPM96_03110 [Ignavibacteria bacterium]|nr:hypothetical protein [Ignavibacteria bacterium]